ncbi:hypothetical protein D3C84_374950 [compost metagenome]
MGDQLEGTVQQCRVHIQRCEFSLDRGRDRQPRQHLVAVDPACLDGLISRAIIEANRTGQRQVPGRGEIRSARWHDWSGADQQPAARFTHKPGNHMLHPRLSLGSAARHDGNGTVGGVDHHTDFFAEIRVKQERAVNFQLFDFHILTGLILQCSSKCDFGETRAREQHRIAHHVVAQ